MLNRVFTRQWRLKLMLGVPDWVNFLLAFVFVSAVFHLIYQIDRRGAVLTRPTSVRSRIYAFLVGLLLGVFFRRDVVTWV